MPPTESSSYATAALHAGLASATRALLAARRRGAMVDAVNAATRSAGIGLAVGAGAMLIARWLDSSRTLAVGVATVVTTLTAGMITVQVTRLVLAVRRGRPTPAEVAQRLDLACDDANRIATALDLADQNHGLQTASSPFIQAAIADGMARLASSSDKAPALPLVAPVNRRWAGMTVASAVALGVVTAWPMGRTPALLVDAQSLKNNALAAIESEAKAEQPAARPPERSPTAAARPSASPQAGSAASSAQSAEQSVGAMKSGASAESSSAATTGRGTAARAGTSADSKNSSAGTGTSAGDPNAQSTPQAIADPSAAAAESAAPTPGAAATGSPGTSPANARTDRGPGAMNAAAAQGRAGASPKSGGEPQSGDGQRDSGAPNRSQSAGDAAGGDRSDSGQGSSSGQSPPKKARGVPPLMLGTHQPDVLIGQPLAGPDERKVIDVPPQPKPPARFDPRATPAAAADESPTDSYRVPADDVAAAARYFEKFHAQPAAP